MRKIKNKEKLEALIKEVVESNPEQGRAIKSIFTSRNHLFITGKPGSGKTFFMKRIIPFIKNCAVVAPTGIAAINAGGTTMHSFFRLNLDPYYPRVGPNGLLKNYNAALSDPNFRSMMEKLDTLIIDEISMVRADVLDKISDVLQQTRKVNKPFGGVRLIMFGDLSQLPPVLTDREAHIFYDNYDTPYFFSSIALRMSGFNVVEFNKIYRQSDPVFINLLSNIRSGKMTKEDIELLNSRMQDIPEDFKGMRIVTHNEMANSINAGMVRKLKGKEYVFEAFEKGNAPKEAQCERTLVVKIGEQVMLTKNKTGEYFNGSLGVIEYINEMDMIITVRLIGGEYDGRLVNVERTSWENNKYSVNEGEVHSNKVGEIIQFPIKAGYSCTSHKVQGMTFDKAVIDVSKSFTNGQAYVALSRCRTMEGMYLTSRITNDQLIQDDRLIGFYNMVEEKGGVIEPVDVYEEMKSEAIDFSKFGL